MAAAPDRPAQRLRILYPSAALLLMTAAFILTKTGRDALYFQKDGLFDLPWAYMGIALLSVPVAGIVLASMRTLGPRRARFVSPIAMAGLQVAFYLLAEPGGGWMMTSFFTLIPLVYGVLFATSWLLGAELLESIPAVQLASAYATLGASSMLGGVLGGIGAKLFAGSVAPQTFILIGAFVLLSAVAVIVLAQMRFPVPATANPGHPPEGASTAVSRVMPPLRDIFGTLSEPYVRSMLAVAATASLVGVFIEFQFYAAAAVSGGGGRENANFFANFYILLNGAALLLQLWAMPALQRRVGVSGSLMVLPLSLFSGALMLVASAAGAGRTALRIAEGGLKSSIYRSNWEQAYLPLSRTKRVIAKVMIDGMGTHMAEGMAAALLLVWLEFFVRGQDLVGLNINWITYMIVAGTLLWFSVTVMLGRTLVPARCTAIREGQLSPGAPLPDSCFVTTALGRSQQRADDRSPMEQAPAEA